MGGWGLHKKERGETKGSGRLPRQDKMSSSPGVNASLPVESMQILRSPVSAKDDILKRLLT